MFLSRTDNRIDAKGRVSVPPLFRNLVSKGGFDGIIVWPSLDGAYLEGCGLEQLLAYQDSLDQMNYYDEGRIALQRAIFAQSHQLSFDSSGRVTLPKELAKYANLDNEVTFVGLGRRFEIWNPNSYDLKSQEVRQLARENQGRLVPVISGQPVGQG